jgi:hypothetical protein
MAKAKKQEVQLTEAMVATAIIDSTDSIISWEGTPELLLELSYALFDELPTNAILSYPYVSEFTPVQHFIDKVNAHLLIKHCRYLKLVSLDWDNSCDGYNLAATVQFTKS